MQKIISNGFGQFGLECTDEMLLQFKTYYDYLTERNAVMNLTAISGEENVARLHFLDCCALRGLYDFSGKSVIDIGSGAGFPGIPLKIAEPSIELTLLDSHQKRVSFVREVCEMLGFNDVHCLCERAEDACADIGGSFDLAVSRAVARLNILCELCLPFVHVGGAFIAMKGPSIAEELPEAANAISVLGGKVSEVKEYNIPGTDITHSAVIIEKVRRCPELYPRQFGQIKKKPL